MLKSKGKIRSELPNRFILSLVLILTFGLLASCGDKKESEKADAIQGKLPPDQMKSAQKKVILDESGIENPAKKEEIRENKTSHEISSPAKAQKIRQAKQLINDAEQLNAVRDYVSALKKLEKAVYIGETTGNPFPKACSLAGNICLKLKDYRNATLYYEKYLQNPDSDKATILESVSGIYYDWGMLYSRFFDVTLNLHLDYYTYSLEMIASTSPEQKEATRYFRGLDYYLSGRFDEAISDLEKMSRIEKPFDALAQIKLGACYYLKGNNRKAEDIWSKVISRSRQDNLILSELLLAYVEVGKPVKAAELSSQRQKILDWLNGPGSNGNHHNMARANLVTISSMRNELDQAIDLFRREDSKIPDMTAYISPASRANFYRASLFKAMAPVYFLKAAEYYRECIKFSPQKTDEYNYKIGLCLFYADEIDEAINTFGKVSKNPFKLRSEVYTAVCFYGKGDRQKAEQIWDRISRESLRSKDKNALRELSYVYSRLGIRLQDAMDYACEIREPLAIAYAHYHTAMESSDQEKRTADFTVATQWFDKSRNTVDYYLDANSPVVLIDLANAYYHRHIYDETARIWAHLLDAYPEAYQIYETIQLINEIWQMKRSEIFEPRWINLRG